MDAAFAQPQLGRKPGGKSFTIKTLLVAETGSRLGPCEEGTYLVQREDVQANKSRPSSSFLPTGRRMSEMQACHSEKEARTSPFPSLEIDHVALSFSSERCPWHHTRTG